MRKPVHRRTVDYSSTVVRYIQVSYLKFVLDNCSFCIPGFLVCLFQKHVHSVVVLSCFGLGQLFISLRFRTLVRNTMSSDKEFLRWGQLLSLT